MEIEIDDTAAALLCEAAARERMQPAALVELLIQRAHGRFEAPSGVFQSMVFDELGEAQSLRTFQRVEDARAHIERVIADRPAWRARLLKVTRGVTETIDERGGSHGD